MTDSPTKVTIGGKEYETSVFNFKRVKKAWPLVMSAATVNDPMESMEFAIQLVALALEVTHPDMTADVIEEQLLSTETGSLKDVLERIMNDNDLMPKTKEVKSGKDEGAAPSTETLTPSSPSLSQQAAAEAIG